ncbi:hypothetical protein D3C78_1218630 [compost metagenome]
MLGDPARAGRHGHLAVGGLVGRVGQGGAFQVFRIEQLHDVHLGGVDGDGDLIRPRGQFGQQVAGVVAQPQGAFAFAFRGEGNRAADLDDHVRHGFTHAGDQLVELGQALGALAVQLAHVQVQHGGAGLVAIDGLLYLLFHGQGNVFREVFRHPLRAVGRDGDDYLFHVFGVQGIVEELHVVVLGLFVVASRRSEPAGARCVHVRGNQKVLSPMIPARSILRWHGG